MSKAVLVMDMPEQVCQKCTLCYETLCWLRGAVAEKVGTLKIEYWWLEWYYLLSIQT